MAIKTIFLDRDGVVNKEIRYLYRLSDFEFIDGIFDACLYFQKLGYEIVIITNQSGIARGYYSERDYLKLTKWMLDQLHTKGISILDILYCPHGPESTCNCRKPRPGMLIEAKYKYNISMKDSWMIGDSESDIKAANAAGISKTILVRSGHRVDESNSNSTFTIDSIKQSKEVIKT